MFGIIRLIVNVVFYVVEVILLLRFLLILFAANLSGTFSRWIFANSATLIGPFKNIFPVVNIGGFAFDFTVLFSLVIYAIVGQLISRVLFYAEYPRETRRL